MAITSRIRVIARGCYLRALERMQNTRFEGAIRRGLGTPREYGQTGDPSVPAHLSLRGWPVGKNGFRMGFYPDNGFWTELKYYDKLGRVRTRRSGKAPENAGES